MKEHNLMSSFELNKIMGAIFSIVLVLLVIKNLGNALYIEDNNFHHTEKKEINIIKEIQSKPEPNDIIIDINIINIYKKKLVKLNESNEIKKIKITITIKIKIKIKR